MTMTISGDGTIGGLVAGGLPNATIVQADLATGVAGTGPAFSAYQSSAQTLTTAVLTKITCTTEEFDTNSNYDTTTSRFTPTVAGYYQFSGGITVATVSTSVLIFLYKNGSSAKRLEYNSGSQVGAYGSALIYLNGSTDYVEFYGYVAATNALQPAAPDTYFQGFLARAA